MSDVEELRSSLSNLVDVFQHPPLDNAATWSPTLRKRVEYLIKSVQFSVLPGLSQV